MTGAEALIITSLVGTGVSAYGQFQQGKQAQSQAKAQAAWNLYNANIAKREAESQRQANLFTNRQQSKKAKSLQATLRARRGASGVEFEGSPLLVAEDNAAELAKEAANIRLTGQRKVQAFESQSILDVSKASAASTRAKGFGQAAVIGAGGSILQGTASTLLLREQLKG